MKKVIVLFICMVLVASTGCQSNNEVYPVIELPQPGSHRININEVDIFIDKGLMNQVDEVIVYTIKKGDVRDTQEKLKELLPGIREYSSIDEQIYFTDDEVTLNIDKQNSYWTYVDKKAENNLYDATEASSITDKECTEIGRKVADTLDIDINGFDDIDVTPIRFEPSIGDPVTIGHTVYFKPIINGLRIYGVSRFSVGIDSKGNVTTIGKYFKEYVPYATAKIISIEEGMSRLMAGGGTITSADSAESINIAECEIMYFDDPSSLKIMPFLQPVMMLKGTTIDENGEKDLFTAAIPALESQEIDKNALIK